MIRISGRDLDVHALHRVAVGCEPCTLSDEARPAIRAGRAVVERIAAEDRAVYGINAGYGPLSGFKVSPEDQALHQVHLLHHLSAGQGPLLEPAETRAVMLARVNTLARGRSGIREEVLDLLVDAMNAGVLPEIHEEGSVGASGDLVPLAHMARLLVGLGYARVGGERLPAAEALGAAGLCPVVLAAKEGLALVNGTSFMTALAALAVVEVEALLGYANLLTACLFQVMKGSPEAFCDALHEARGQPGQIAVARDMVRHLRTHPDFARAIDDGWDTGHKPIIHGHEIQDPYSLRCAPQILGAVRDALTHVTDVVNRELNAVTDNPLVFAEHGWVVHGGNFYGQHVSMASDYLRLGLVKAVLLLERQLDRLVNWRYSGGLPPMLTGAEPGLNSGFAGVQLLATSLAAEARLLAVPASVQSIPTNANNQDLVSMGALAARTTRRVLPIGWKLVGIQALALCQAADLRGADHMGGSFQALHDEVRALSPRLASDRPLFEDVTAVTTRLAHPEVRARLLGSGR